MVLLPLSVHNLFCSLVLKRESRSQEYVWGLVFGSPIFTTWVKNSSLGSRKIKFITWVNQSSEYSLLGSDSKLGSEHKILYFPRFQYEESMSFFKMSGSISIFKASISMFYKYTKYINIFKKYINIYNKKYINICKKKYINIQNKYIDI